MKHFSRDGICLFGKHKGTHASRLPKLWTEWACQNVNDFKTSFASALSSDPAPPPSARKRGRTYILKPHLRYVP